MQLCAAACQIQLSTAAAVGSAANGVIQEGLRKEKCPLKNGSGSRRAARVRPIDYTLISAAFVPMFEGTLRTKEPCVVAGKERGGMGSGNGSGNVVGLNQTSQVRISCRQQNVPGGMSFLEEERWLSLWCLSCLVKGTNMWAC